MTSSSPHPDEIPTAFRALQSALYPQVCPRLSDAQNEFYESPTAKERAQKTVALREFIGAATSRSQEFNTNSTRAMKNLFGPLYVICLSSVSLP